MKNILTLSLLLTSSLCWSVSAVKVQNFNFNYMEGAGTGSAISFEVIKNQSQVFVNRAGNDLVFSSSLLEENAVWRNAPSFVLDSAVEVKGFNLHLSKTLTATLSSGKFVSDTKMAINSVSVECARDKGADVFEEVINGCLEKGVVKVTDFVSQSVESFLAKFSEKEFYPENTQVRSLNLVLLNNNFNLSANAKFGINGTLKARGNAQVDYLKRKGTLKITEVKFGILNITNKFFDEVRKMEIKGLVVNQPYLYFNLPVKE